MADIIVWGAGNRTKSFVEQNMFVGNNILAIVDSADIGKEFMGYPAIKPDEIAGRYSFEYIVVSNQFYQEIVAQLLELGIALTKIIISDHVKEQPYKECFDRGKKIIPEIYEMMRKVIKQSVKTNERDYIDSESIFANSRFEDMEYHFDYFRYRTVEFAAEKIKKDGIEGNLAEVGVFRGLFSAVLNYCLPDRKLFLFDTFEGFSEMEAKRELEQGRCSASFIASHKDTSIERMLKNIPYPEQAVVLKGFFPDTVTREVEESVYAFVSLDVDFEESTLEGLKFFYPRLSEGGYIFVHDYNTYYLDGIKAAVKQYEKLSGYRLKTVPIADRAGTLIIVK